ncbi:RTA-like protein [Niveomyces insectorum RCEF 264]|uniref:RTA-like protein n=1 Tax=Niveomyces insectorum RCEF 264 TaxID=1081102 RepID=A0A167PJP6_9HYPO|nr:RTA-like protein [Niveomyces insectorum RCEF 264]
MVYSRVVRAVDGVRFSPMPPRWTTAVFVVGDLLCLNIQSTGGGMLAKTESANTGDHIIVTGLVLQVLVFCCFLVNCLIFHRRFHAHAAAAGTATNSNAPWQACLHMLYATSFFILVRNIYRVVEFITGQDGYLLEHEWPTYAFDGALMLLVMIGFFVWYPSQLKPVQRDTMIELRSVNEASPPPVHVLGGRLERWFDVENMRLLLCDMLKVA